METTAESSTTPPSEQLNDLQSYLNTFNKEIGSTGESEFTVVSQTSSDQEEAIGVSPTEEEKQNIFLLDDGNVEASVLKTQKGVEIGGDDNMDNTEDASEKQNEEVNELDMDTATIQDLTHIESASELQTITVAGLPNISEGELIRVQVPSSSGGLGTEKMVFLNGQSSIQLIEKDGQLTVSQAVDEGGQGGAVVTQTSQIDEAGWSGTRLVAVRNAQDSSQPQLVAVHGDGSQPTPEGDESNEDELKGNKIVLNTGDQNFEAVATCIVPTSIGGGDGEMNYVLIVSNTEGDKDGAGAMMSQVDLDSVKTEPWGMVQNFVQDGKTLKRLIIPSNTDPMGHQPLLACRYCDYTSPKKYLLMRHLKSHSIDKPHKCTLCERAFKTLASLQNHHNTHTGTRPHKCKQCEAAFTTSGELVRHIRYKHTFEKPHKCTECDYASVELSKLKRHMRSHTGERPYHCPHCNYASPDTYKLKRHLRIHTGEKPYTCDICGARFTQSNSLKAHKLIHSGSKPVFQCDMCPTTCGRKTDLKIHMQKLHSSEKPLQCKKCMQEFPDRYSYKLHLKTHEGEKCFHCEYCDYSAYSMRLLESHLLTHTGEKPFPCEICGSTFRQKQLLKRHMQLYHTPEDEVSEPPKPKRTKMSSEVTGSPLTAEQLLQGSLLNDMKEGKLGEAPKVVIVHPDGRVEEVTGRLQTLAQQHGLEEVMMKMAAQSENSEEASSDTMSSDVALVTNNRSGQTFSVHMTEDVDDSYTDESKNEGTQVSLETDSEQSSEGVSRTNLEGLESHEEIQLSNLAKMGNGRVIPVSFQLASDSEQPVVYNDMAEEEEDDGGGEGDVSKDKEGEEDDEDA